MSSPEPGWAWFEGTVAPAPDGAARATEVAFARCFAGPDGERVLRHLRAITLDRHMGPDAGDAALRHLEGQRHLVAYVTALIDRGRI